MNPVWTITLAPLGPFPPLTLHLASADEFEARSAIAKMYPDRVILSAQQYGVARKENLDPPTKAEEIKSGYLNSGREDSDEDEAVLWLMEQCGELFADNEDARRFLTEKPRRENPNENCLQGFECPACGSYGPFRIRATVSGETLVTDFGTEGVEGDVEWEDHSRCRCADCGHGGTVREFLGKPVSAFGRFQAVAASAYDQGEHLCSTPDDISGCGDSLLTFIMKELAESEGCDSAEEAILRLNVAIRQIEQVRNAMETTWTGAERAILRQQGAQAAH